MVPLGILYEWWVQNGDRYAAYIVNAFVAGGFSKIHPSQPT
jgi:hypothetical protein